MEIALHIKLKDLAGCLCNLIFFLEILYKLQLNYAAKDKLPDLDDGGTGLPPRDDGDGGGGGGGGGGNYSGGFFFFGFLAFLGFLKDKETEDPNERRRRR